MYMYIVLFIHYEHVVMYCIVCIQVQVMYSFIVNCLDNYGSTLSVRWTGKQDTCIIMEIKVSLQLLLLCGIQHSVIMADFLMFETQQPIIVIIFIIYSSYFLKDLIELYEYISGRIAISTSFYVSYKQLSFCQSFLIDRDTQNDTTSLTTYITHSYVRMLHKHTNVHVIIK